MAAVRAISWNGSSSGDGKSLLLISSWISALSLCGDHSSRYTTVVSCSQIWQLCLCLVPPLSYTDRWQQSLISVSLISAGYEREREKWRVCWSFSISLTLSLCCCFVFEPSSVFHCAMGIYCGNGHGLQVGLAYMGTHTHILFSPFPRCMHVHLRHGVIYHHSLHYLSMIFLHCLPIQQRKIS